MSFGERIKEYIDYKKISVRKFEQNSNLKNGAIHRVINNHTTLNGESIQNVGLSWDDLNLNWLMKGDGEMLLLTASVQDVGNEYNKDIKRANNIMWCHKALERADGQIKLQKDMIDLLKEIIEKQKETAKKVGIDL